MKTFRVYFTDGNQRMFKARYIINALNYVVYELKFNASDIIRVEEVL